MKYYVESSNGFGAWGVVAECNNYADAKRYAHNYSLFNGVITKVTTIYSMNKED